MSTLKCLLPYNEVYKKFELIHFCVYLLCWNDFGFKKVADVSDAVRQYADGLMLSGESAIGSFAEKALSVMKIASEQMESSSRREFCQSLIYQPLLAESSVGKIAEQICKSAVEIGTFSFMTG